MKTLVKSTLKGDEEVRYDAIKQNLVLWPNATVPYVFNCSFDEQGKTAVRGAIKEISKKTCMKFIERTNERDYVEFFNGRGCWSFVGLQKTGRQRISLHERCTVGSGIAVHEIMHTLGYQHEHNRFVAFTLA